MSNPETTRPADPYLRVRRHYLTGLFTSSLGGGMVSLVSSFLIYQQTKRASDVALIIVLSNVPALLLPSVATKLADRWGGPRLYIRVWGAYYTLGMLPFVLGITGHLTATSLLVWYLLLGIVQGLGTPAAGLVRTELAPDGGSSEFNGAAVRATAVATMVGILLGGAALSLIGPSWIYFVSALSGAPLVLAVVPLLKTVLVENSTKSNGFSEARKVQRTNPEIRAAFRFGLIIFLLSGYAVTLPAIASGIGHRPMILSSLQAAAVFGGLFVVAGVRSIHRRSTWLKVQRACVIVIGLTILYLGWVALRDHQPLWYLATAILAIIPLGFALNLDTSILNAAVQVAAPPHARTPVLTAFALIPMVAMPLSEVLIGGVADLVSTSFALMMVGGLTLLLVLIPRHGAARAAFTAIDDEHVFPEEGLAHAMTIDAIEEAGGVITNQIVGPEITNPEDRER